MKTPFFIRYDTKRLKKALFLLSVAIVIIALSVPGMIYFKGISLFALFWFFGFILFFYSLLHPWLKARYYAISILIFTAIPLILTNMGIDFLVNLEKAGKLWPHGSEDLAWAIGSIFVAGIISGIIGVIRSRLLN
jgi:hypothetical protein